MDVGYKEALGPALGGLCEGRWPVPATGGDVCGRFPFCRVDESGEVAPSRECGAHGQGGMDLLESPAGLKTEEEEDDEFALGDPSLLWQGQDNGPRVPRAGRWKGFGSSGHHSFPRGGHECCGRRL